jgi:hypothetical protein
MFERRGVLSSTVRSLEAPAMRTRDLWLFCGALMFFPTFCLVVVGLTSDDTVYAPGYSATKFRRIRVGMSREEVTRALGKPLSVDPAPGYVMWVYAPDDYRNPRLVKPLSEFSSPSHSSDFRKRSRCGDFLASLNLMSKADERISGRDGAQSRRR